MQIQDTTLQKQSCAELPPSHRTMEKLGCHTMLHALQHVKLSLPDKLIRKAISYTWLDIFPASFNNLYCIYKFTGCAVSLSPDPSQPGPQWTPEQPAIISRVITTSVPLQSLILLLQMHAVPMPGSFFHLSQENESSKMLLSNAFYELCSALQWLALLRIL